MDADPTPGDPDLIQNVARRYRDISDAAEQALNLLKADGAIAKGQGSAMEQLKAKIGDDLPDKLTKTVTSYRDAAQAYSNYSPRLREAQDRFDQAVDRAQAAAPKANRSPLPLGDDPSDEDRRNTRAAQDSIAEGTAEMSAARSLAEQARSMRESAQRRCADVLDQAAGEAIPERNVFQKIADFFKDFPFVQILISALIAVVAVFFPLVGALLGGLLFVFNQVVASQTGGVKAGDFITGLLGVIPGGSLFKLGGNAVEAIAPGAVAAVRNSGFIARSAGTITRVSESFTNRKIVAGFLNQPVGRVVVDVTKGFLGNAALEAAAKAANRDQITAAGVFAGAAAGAVAGVAFKGGVGAIGKARGNRPVEDGQGGRFGDTTEPRAEDSLGKKIADQVGGTIEEGAVLGTKIGVGVAQGGVPNEVAAGEIANSAPRLAVGVVGRGGVGRAVDSLTAGVPFKGPPRPQTAAAQVLPGGPTSRPNSAANADASAPSNPDARSDSGGDAPTASTRPNATQTTSGADG
ncbi:hypothetical protein [Streptomyces fructofermentans]|uniref:hypothetical protein n=1 Tax=Streptomyces fructofermentans TaxID=152141 RepID=UPI0033C1F94E